MSHATASIIVRDGLIAAQGREMKPLAERRAIRIALVLVMGVSYAVAVSYTGSFVDLVLYYAYGPIVQFAPVIVATLYWKRATGPGVLSGMSVGIAVYLVLVIWPELAVGGVSSGLYAVFANTLTLVVVSLSSRSALSEREREYLAVAGTPPVED